MASGLQNRSAFGFLWKVIYLCCLSLKFKTHKKKLETKGLYWMFLAVCLHWAWATIVGVLALLVG